MIAADTIQALLDPLVRAAGAPELASIAGASHLCVFIRDPELSKLLPAPGFPQRLPKGLAWAQYLQEVDQKGSATAKLPSPFLPETVSVSGSRINQSTVLVLFGGRSDVHRHAELAPAMNVIGALFLQEVRTKLAEIQASVARNAATESRKLAVALSDVHDRLAREFQRTQALSEEVARQHERLSLARRVSGVGEWQYVPEAKTVTFSPQAAVIFGFEFAPFEQPISLVLENVHAPDRRLAESAFSGAILPTSSETDRNTQFRVCAQDGSFRWVENRSMPFRAVESSKASVIGISVDVTHRVLTEEKLLGSERLAAAGRLAASIAHEINNPLEGLVNLIYLARQEDDIASVRKLLADADGEAARVASVARQSLSFYRDVNTPICFDLRSTVEELVGLHASQASKYKVLLRTRISSRPAEVHGWPGEMKQVISNLLINAMHASSPSTEIWTRVYPGRECHRLVVADAGHGIPPEITKRIFEPFFSTRHDSGTGLGLWVARQIVEKHGGTIRLRTSTAANRHGTCFLITLPAAGTAKLGSNDKGLRDRWAELGRPASSS